MNETTPVEVSLDDKCAVIAEVAPKPPSIWQKIANFFKKEPESNLVSYAKRELKAAGYDPESKDFGSFNMHNNVLELIMVFASQGHSGFSASVCRDLFGKLAAFEPICPLTGVDDEWVEVGNNLWQNKRCSRVFKNEKGEAFDVDGKVFVDEHGGYTNKDSHVPVTFPYTPKTEYVDVTKKQEPLADVDKTVKTPKKSKKKPAKKVKKRGV